MYKIVFFRDYKGNQPIKEYLELLKNKNDKNSRIKLKKLQRILKLISCYGLSLGMPHIRRIQNDLWEIRSIRDRMFFFCYKNEEFVLLHYFIKKTNKTPQNEIEKAIYEMNYYIKWRENDERKL